MDSILAAVNSRVGVPLLFGSGQAVRKDVLIETGGWKEGSVTEDVDFSIKALKAGYKSAYRRLPVIGDGKFSAEAGPLLSYSVDYLDSFRRSTVYMVKILNGARPGDLPIEQPTKFKLVVNMKVARELGLTIPESIMVRADQVIQ